jgi:hypothetical protein
VGVLFGCWGASSSFLTVRPVRFICFILWLRGFYFVKRGLCGGLRQWFNVLGGLGCCVSELVFSFIRGRNWGSRLVLILVIIGVPFLFFLGEFCYTIRLLFFLLMLGYL